MIYSIKREVERENGLNKIFLTLRYTKKGLEVMRVLYQRLYKIN